MSVPDAPVSGLRTPHSGRFSFRSSTTPRNRRQSARLMATPRKSDDDPAPDTRADQGTYIWPQHGSDPTLGGAITAEMHDALEATVPVEPPPIEE